jgi:hypothetical protein
METRTPGRKKKTHLTSGSQAIVKRIYYGGVTFSRVNGARRPRTQLKKQGGSSERERESFSFSTPTAPQASSVRRRI